MCLRLNHSPAFRITYRAFFSGLVLATTLAIAPGCSNPIDSDNPGNSLPPNLTESSEKIAGVTYTPLPETINQRVRETLSQEIGVPITALAVMRHSRETWSDSCLGLGGPAESCLQALVEGWQVEVVNTTNSDRYYYRTDLEGNNIRRSTLENNLPPSVRDRIFLLTVETFEISPDSLTLVEAEPQDWDGCMGLASPEEICTMIAILGWRAVISDGTHTWIYHTDGLGTDIRLNTAASDLPAVPQ